jgi:hypothetical protein
MSAFRSQTSVPGRSCRWRFASFVSQIFRGSATTRVAPLRAAFFIRRARTGCASVVFDPITKMNFAFSISGIELVVAPLPNDLTRPYRVGACQVASQEWMEFVPIAVRASFWMRKFSSIVRRADARKPIDCGP